MTNGYHAGLDFSNSDAVFALQDAAGTIVLEDLYSPPRRAASGIPEHIRALLASRNLTFQNIGFWSVGAGPGSFTGLRLASSFVMGLCQGTGARCRAVSSANALALAALGSVCSAAPSARPGRVLALYDGRKQEILSCGLRVEGAWFEEETSERAVLGSADDFFAASSRFEVAVALEKDRAAMEAVFGPDATERILFVRSISAAALVQERPGDFTRDPADLVYLRPAVFVEPKAIRAFPAGL